LAIIASSVVVVRLAHGRSLFHPVFLLVVALGIWAGVAAMFFPRAWWDTPDKTAEATVAWLKRELDGKAVME
jgi:ABC-type dipeptide/oligopeptide/nickel transport system permease component